MYDQTYLIVASVVIFNLLDLIGIKVAQSDVQTTVITVYTVVMGIYLAIRQKKQANLKWFGKKV
jgi:hypothetical protein